MCIVYAILVGEPTSLQLQIHLKMRMVTEHVFGKRLNYSSKNFFYKKWDDNHYNMLLSSEYLAKVKHKIFT